MKLHALVDASAAVAATRSRKKKIAHLADVLRALPAPLRGVGASYLAGELPQGRIGLGWATFRDLDPGAPASAATLALAEVHARFDELAAISGKGASAARQRHLGALFAQATETERDFLMRLVLGELRQGALEGLLADAIAQAAGLEATKVRRAAMLSGSLPAVAEAALGEGDAGLSHFQLTLFRPVLPMLAQPTDDVDAALATLGEAAFELKLDGARVQLHKDGD